MEYLVKGDIIFRAKRDLNGAQWIKPDDAGEVRVTKTTLMDLHERYGHISFNKIKSLPEAEKVSKEETTQCGACIKGKITKAQVFHR